MSWPKNWSAPPASKVEDWHNPKLVGILVEMTRSSVSDQSISHPTSHSCIVQQCLTYLAKYYRNVLCTQFLNRDDNNHNHNHNHNHNNNNNNNNNNNYYYYYYYYYYCYLKRKHTHTHKNYEYINDFLLVLFWATFTTSPNALPPKLGWPWYPPPLPPVTLRGPNRKKTSHAKSRFPANVVT